MLVLAQKIVSKAEGRLVALADVPPSPRAVTLAVETAKDPRVVELVLRESAAVVRHRPGVLVVEHRLGAIMANAGIDASNVAGDDHVLLLPADPDASAARLRTALLAATGHRSLGVIIADSWGRPWRRGTVGTALGVAGLPALRDLRGTPDRAGRPLRITEVGHADELAAAASLLMGQAAEGRPLVVIRGLPPPERADGTAAELLRPRAEDLFR